MITDFTAGDSVQLGGYWSAQSLSQVGADVVVLFNTGDQITFKNAIVTTVQSGLQFAPDPSMILTGTRGNDTLNGGSGQDTLIGGAGHDSLNGGANGDTMQGDRGNDTYYVDAAGDVVMEVSSQGTDLVCANMSYTLPKMSRTAFLGDRARLI